ncbi:hypothetical protein KFK09_010312 [Dendrobium nobile]|uniref:DUF8204 domain-containing protein n=1 Tax=Dendrobium nobile TaxID=94219 RepID=A0A8T3BJE4_DENNO|nr:hypothetical protein KFK09_010312 [Dendrobium nobile]
MEESSAGGGGGDSDQLQGPRASSYKGKSCKGCLYFSSVLKANARNPVCFGISRTLPQVPSHIVGESEMEAANDGRSLSDFKYACLGYSVFMDDKDTKNEKREEQAELPFCAGLELLVDRRTSNASHAPAHVHNKEDASARSHPRPYKPPQALGEEFMSRFSRNAGLVASGVARNLNRVGNYIKETFDDILYPYRRRPK